MNKTSEICVFQHSSDTELLERDFISNDPENLPNLSKSLPSNYNEAEIEYRYDVTPTKGTQRKYIWCAREQCPKDWKGYVMKTPEGVRFLIGKDCGKKVFGIDFNASARGFQASIDRQYYLRKILSAKNQFPQFMDTISNLISNSVVSQYSELRESFRKTMPSLFNDLTEAVKKEHGQLIIHEKIRDYAAEERRSAQWIFADQAQSANEKNLTTTKKKKLRKVYKDEIKYRNTIKDIPIYKSQPKSFGNITGVDLFIEQPAPSEGLKKLRKEFRNIGFEIKSISTEQLRLTELKKLINTLSEKIENVYLQIDRLKTPIQFFSNGSLERIIHWLSSQTRHEGYYSVDNNELLLLHKDSKTTIKLPTNYKIPELNLIDSFRSILFE